MAVIGHGYDDNVGAPAFRNVIINGAMSVAQRNTSVANITSNSYNTADRWQAVFNTLGTWTQSVELDAPAGSGLRNSLKMLCTTADASPAAADEASIQTVLEGQNLQIFCKGTANAKKFALQFWVKSNKTGTYTVWLYDGVNNRQISAIYTINASDTWEKKTIIFIGDTSGAFANDNNAALNVRFYLASGSNLTSGTLNTSWTTNPLASTRVSGSQANLAAAANNYWQITGVQLEAGDITTPFEFEPYETTLRKCQRYYYIAYAGNSSNGIPLFRGNSPTVVNRYFATFSAPVAPRTTNFIFPIISSGTQIHKPNIRWDTANSMTVDNIGSNNYYFGVNPGTDDGASYYVCFLASVAIINDAEL